MKNFFSKEKEKEKEKKEKDKDKEKTAEKTKEGDRKGGAKSDAEKQANPMRPATSGRPVRFVSATLTHLYYTIPVISSTTTLDAICKIEQKIVTLGQGKKTVRIFERIISEFPVDRELGPDEKILPLMEEWMAHRSKNLFVVRECDVPETREEAHKKLMIPITKKKKVEEEQQPFRTEITTFLPDYVKNIYLFSLGAPNKPTCEVFPAAVMFVDIAGFTSFTEKLAKLGDIGVETLCMHMNELFSLLISVVRRNYGDVIQFGGDSVLILWESPLATLQDLILQACECGLQIQDVFTDYHTRQAYAQSAGIKLSLYVAIAAGDMNNYHVGAPGKWSIVFAGDPILQIAREMGHCAPGEIVVSPEAWCLLQGSPADGQKGKEILKGKRKIAGGQETRQHGGLLGLFSAKKKVGAEATTESEEEMPYLLQAIRPPSGDRKSSQGMRKKAVTPTAAYYMRAYVSRAVLACVDTGLMDWIRELREVVVVFLNLPDLDDFESEDFLPTLQLATEILQTEITRWDGTINKFIMDDKGCLLLCGFGMPLSPTTHIAIRAVAAALNIKRLMSRAKITVTIGITIGENYCGLVGSRQRQEFTIMGDFVNLAARLMKIKINEGVLCDEGTYLASKQFIKYGNPDEVMVKGKEKPILAYKPLGIAHPEKIQFLCRNSEGSAPSHREKKKKEKKQESSFGFVGRSEDIEFLEERLAEVRKHKDNLVVLVEGEPGMGRTTLMRQFTDLHRALPVFYGRGLPPSISPDSVVPELSPFRDLVAGLWGGVGDGSDEAKEKLEEQLEEEGFDNASIFNALLDLRVPETRPASMLTKNARRKRQIQLIVDRMKKLYPNEKVLIVEDINLLDTLSWALITTLVECCSSLLVILTRDSTETSKGKTVSISPSDGFLSTLMGRPNSRSFVLKPPGDDVLRHVLCSYIGAHDIPKELEEVAKETSNPLLCRDFAITAMARKLVKVVSNTAELTLSPKEFAEAVEEPLNRIALARIDSLLSHLKLSIKVAAALGNVFCAGTIAKFHPSRLPFDEVVVGLDELCRVGFLRKLEGKEEWEKAQMAMAESPFSRVDDVVCDSTPFEGDEKDKETGLREEEGGGRGKAAEVWYAFRFKRCRKVANGLMLHTQRQQLHDAFAKYFENITDYFVLKGCGGEKEREKGRGFRGRETFARLQCLAYHWKNSEEKVRALGYLQSIGTLAFNVEDYVQSEDAFTEALKIAEEVSFKDLFLIGRWTKGCADAILFSSTKDPKEKVEKAKDLYQRSKASFEEQLQATTTLRASLTPQSVVSLYGDIGRIFEEVEMLLFSHLPALSSVPTPALNNQSHFLYALDPPSSLSGASPSPLPDRLPANIQSLALQVQRAMYVCLGDGALVLLERLRNALVAAKFAAKAPPMLRRKEEEKGGGKEGKEKIVTTAREPSASQQRKIIDIRLFLNLKRENWLLPFLLSEAGLVASIYGFHELSEWYWGQSFKMAEKVYHMYALGHSAIFGNFGEIPYLTTTETFKKLKQGMVYLATIKQQKVLDNFPILLDQISLLGDVGIILSNLKEGRVRNAMGLISEAMSHSGNAYELVWLRLHCILLKKQKDGGPGLPDTEGLFSSLKLSRPGGFSLLDRLGFLSLQAKRYAKQGDWAKGLQAASQCAKLIQETSLGRGGTLLCFFMLCDLFDALALIRNSSHKIASSPASQHLLLSGMSTVLERLGTFPMYADLFRIRLGYYETVVMGIEGGKPKKMVKTLGKLIEQTEKAELYYDLAVLYQHIIDILPSGRKEIEPFQKICAQISRAFGFYWMENDLKNVAEKDGGENEIILSVDALSSLAASLADAFDE